MSKNNKFNKGFTLIEILLVIVLLGLLMSIVLVNLNTVNRFTESRNDIRSIHIKTLEGAITQYRLQEGSYPTVLSRDYKEICDPGASACDNFVDLKTVLVPKYLQAIPQDPKDNDNTEGAGYSVAVDKATNTVAVKAINSEGGVKIEINVPLPDLETVNTNNPLDPTEPIIISPTSTPATPSIVQDGLILHLDAGDSASYTGSGTTNWKDISGSGYDFTINPSAYSVSNGIAHMNFEGSFGAAKRLVGGVMTNIPNEQNGTIMVFSTILLNNNSNWRTLIRGASNDHQAIISSGSNSLGMFDNDTGAGFLNSGFDISSLPNPYTQFNCLIWKFSQSSPFYQFQYNNNPTIYSITNSNAIFNNGFSTIGAYHNFSNDVNNSSQYWGKVAVFLYYNKHLSSSEIKQNYDVFKSRFGLTD